MGAPLHVEAFDRSSFGSEDAQKNKPASVCIKPDTVNALILARACGVRPHVLVGIQRELILTRFARGGRCIEPVSGLICTA